VKGKTLRKAYGKEFKRDDQLKAWATKQAPPKRTKTSSIRSGKRVESGEANVKQEAYKSVDIFTKYLWYHDKNKHNMNDNAHQFSNVMKQMMNSIKNRTKKDKLHFNGAIRAKERAQGISYPTRVLDVCTSSVYCTSYVVLFGFEDRVAHGVS
jgi:hypothetical protein